MEKTFKVKPIGVKYLCDSCNVGEMNYTNDMEFENGVPIFRHRCTNCDNETKFTQKYPTIDFVEI